MILLYNTNSTQNPNAYLTLAVEEAMRRLLPDESVRRVDERSLLAELAGGTCRLLLCLDGQRLNAGLIARARPAVRRLVLWVFEDPFMLDQNLANTALFDLIFTNDPSCVDAYRGKGHFLPLAASHTLHYHPVRKDAALKRDIFFAGTMWPNRVRAMRRIIAAFPDAAMTLVCPTNPYLPPLPPAIAERAITTPISHQAFTSFANTSRVTLTLFRDYASHSSAGLATAPGPRLFELAMAGTAQVVHRHERMQDSAIESLDGVLLADHDRLAERIGEVLADPGRRHDLASRAQAAALAAHQYDHRLRELLALALEAPGAQRPETGPPPHRRLRVLMCTHATLRGQVWGGVEVYQHILTTALRHEVEIFTWVRGEGQCRLLDSAGHELERFEGAQIGWLDVLCDSFEERHFADMLSTFGIDVVHFQHLGHHAASLPLIAKACGTGTVMSVHDFFLVCARYNLLDYEQKFCDIGERPLSACAGCLAADGLPVDAQRQRRAFMEQVLGAIDLLLFGSRQSETLLCQVYPQVRRARRRVLGIPSPDAGLPPSARQPSREAVPGVLEIVVVGNFLHTKGADTVLQVIERAPPELFRFHIMGSAEPHYEALLRERTGPNLVYHGRYAPGELPLLEGQVALHLSIWPETWCISLSEVWEAGMIPIVTDIGALGERVTHGVDGFKVRVDDASAVLDLLEVLRCNPALRERMRGAIGPHLWRDAATHAEALLAEYRALAPRIPLGRGASLGLDVAALHLLAQYSWKELPAPRHILDASELPQLRLDLPAAIDEWASLQSCHAYVDSLCDIEFDPLLVERPGERRVVPDFAPQRQLTIKGWVFRPNSAQSGQVFVCLIHQTAKHVLFLDAVRTARPDVQTIFPEAPVRCGYQTEVALAGRWSDGEYAVGLIVTAEGRAAFHMTKHQVSFLGGRVVQLATVLVEPAAILHGFACVISASPLAERLLATRAEPAVSATVPPRGRPRPARSNPTAAAPSAPAAAKRRARNSGRAQHAS